MDQKTKKKAGTFALNRREPIHSWYSYVEGYSSCLVEDELNSLENKDIKTVYDPFGGTGTTPLVAIQHGFDAYYSETNPFMLSVMDAKINVVFKLAHSKTGTKGIEQFLKWLNNYSTPLLWENVKWDGFEKFFKPEVLSIVLDIKSKIEQITDEDTRKILMLALSSILVRCSNMNRRGDLRYATENEKTEEDFDVVTLLKEKIKTIISDIKTAGSTVQKCAVQLSPDAREIDLKDTIDCVITSPPYLNGTNYIRNTKLELKLNNYVTSEKDLPAFHSKGIIAGINNVSKRHGEIPILAEVSEYIQKLEPVVYDVRIPIMIAGYFYDMDKVIQKLAIAMKNDGYFIMDIGDSQFANIHIPTHEILSKLCEKHGFRKYDETILRERHSKNGMVLSQRVLRFRLEKNDDANEDFKQSAEAFIGRFPYKESAFSGRNWGHSWHSLCSYHGKLKPSIAYFLVKEFTKKGDRVLDPLCGVGTIPFEACLQGRIGIGNDLSEMAYVVSKAKLEKPVLHEVEGVVNQLSAYIEDNKNTPENEDRIKDYEDFGYNGKLPSYFHPETLKEIMAARSFFVPKIPTISSSEALVYSALLHILHGNRPYALSRNSHPLTPYSPKGDFVYKNVIEHINDKISISYKETNFENYVQGQAIWGDYQKLPKSLDGTIDCIICSPPFADSMRFYMQNWMRLWLCGWETDDYKTADEEFLDTKQKKDFGVYRSFFETCYRVLKPNGKIILHLGKTDKYNMVNELSKYATPQFEIVCAGDEDVTSIEKHGVDKGRTVGHQFLFLEKN